MNSHATALNLQSSGQTAVVGHHRGFSQVSASNQQPDCPWFMAAHQMPPTAPIRQHKRPAPQPGILLHTQQPQPNAKHHPQMSNPPPQVPPHSSVVSKHIFFLWNIPLALFLYFNIYELNNKRKYSV